VGPANAADPAGGQPAAGRGRCSGLMGHREASHDD